MFVPTFCFLFICILPWSPTYFLSPLPHLVDSVFWYRAYRWVYNKFLPWGFRDRMSYFNRNLENSPELREDFLRRIYLSSPWARGRRIKTNILDCPSRNLAFIKHQKLKKDINGLKLIDRNLFGLSLSAVVHLTQSFPGCHYVITSPQGRLPFPPTSRHQHPSIIALTNISYDSLCSSLPTLQSRNLALST